MKKPRKPLNSVNSIKHLWQKDGLYGIRDTNKILRRSIDGINESKERLSTMRTSIKSQIYTVLDLLIDDEE